MVYHGMPRGVQRGEEQAVQDIEKFTTEEYGFFRVRRLEDGRVIGLKRFMFTIGLVYDIDDGGYGGRFCYSDLVDAMDAFDTWDGIRDPSGNWIKEKGRNIERTNPKLRQGVEHEWETGSV